MIVLLLLLLCQTCLSDNDVERKYVVLISDTHIGGDWFKGPLTKSLPKFLNHMTKPTTDVHTFVIVGDMLDFWMKNFTERVPTPVEMMESQDLKGVNVSEYISILKEMIKNNVEVVYVRGNHDIQLEYEHFVAVGLKEIKFHPEVWTSNNFHVEHGNRFDLFNSPDPARSDVLPFGYPITRAYAEAGNFERPLYNFRNSMNGDESAYFWVCDHILAYAIELLKDVPWLIERVIGGALGEKPWDEILNKRFQEHKHDIVENGCVYPESWEDEDLERQTHKYDSVVKRFIHTFGKVYSENLVKGMCHDASYFMERMDAELFVMGHLHETELSVVDQKETGKKMIYANTGSWTIHAEWLPFVRITQPNKGNATFVELMEFNEIDYEFITKESSPVPYKKSSSLESYQDIRANMFSKFKNTPFPFPLNDDSYTFKSKGARVNKFNITVPEGWICDDNFYGTNDGCDCECGVPDPDCSCTKEKECTPSCCKN